MFVSLYNKIDVDSLLFKTLTLYILDWYPFRTFSKCLEPFLVEKEGGSEIWLVQSREQPLVAQSCKYSEQGSEKLDLKKTSLAYLFDGERVT